MEDDGRSRILIRFVIACEALVCCKRRGKRPVVTFGCPRLLASIAKAGNQGQRHHSYICVCLYTAMTRCEGGGKTKESMKPEGRRKDGFSGECCAFLWREGGGAARNF